MDRSFILGVAIAAGIALMVSQQIWPGIFVTTVSESGKVAVYSYGAPVTMMHTIGVLQAAILELCDIATKDSNGA